MCADDDAAGIKRRFEHRKGFARFGVSTHEDVESRITFFRPCMDADMAFGEYGNSGNAAPIRKRVQMDVQKRRPCHLHCIDQRLFDPIPVVESLGVPKIYDQVTSRIGQSVTCDEVILAVLIPQGNRNRNGPRRSASTRALCFFDRRYEFKSSHSGTYPLSSVDTCGSLWSCDLGPPLRRKRRAKGIPSPRRLTPEGASGI